MIRKHAILALALTAGVGSVAATRPLQPGLQHWIVAPVGNEGRYIVRETLFGHEFPNDAVGKTTDITGDLYVDPTGKVVGPDSKITINVQKLASDQSRRDKAIREQSIESNKYPTVTIVPKSFAGLAGKPSATPVTFDFVGDLTVRTITKPTTWTVTAHSQGPDVVGTAKTAFTFADFGIDKPKTPMVNGGLGVEDTIKLEYDFHFTQKTP